MLALLTTALLALPGAVVRRAGVAVDWKPYVLQRVCEALFATSLAHHGTRPRKIDWVEHVDKAMCRITVATSAVLCDLSKDPICLDNIPFWLSLMAVWSVSGPVSRHPQYYERGWHREHAAMHCAAAAGLTALANILVDEGSGAK